MTEQQNITDIIGIAEASKAAEAIRHLVASRPDEAPSVLAAIVRCDEATPQVLVEAGKALWRMGRRGDALSAYERAAKADPDGPASLLLEHSNSIMDFFNPELLNP